MLFQQVVSRVKRLRQSLALSAVSLAVIAVVPISAQAATFSLENIDQIYVFGDSLSDTGNTFRRTGSPPPPNFNGRYSNGLVWVEYLADDLGLARNPSTNFAFAGATTGSNNTGSTALPQLQDQIAGFTANNPTADPNGLYIVWAGGSDYLSGSVFDPTIPVTNLSNAVQSLAGVGARNILVVNLPDLGQLPGTRTTPFAGILSGLSAAHNSGLATTLNNLSQSLPNVNIIPFDVNALGNRIFANPAQFGLTNVTDSCLTQVSICANPNQYLFWDDIHATTVSHQIIADAAFSTLQPTNVPEPSSAVGILAFGALGAASMLKRKPKKVSFVKTSKVLSCSTYKLPKIVIR